MLRFLTVLFLSLCTAHAQDEARLLAEFTKAVQPGKGKSIAPDAAKQALGGLAGLDSPKTADALMDGWLAADGEANGIDQERQTHNAEMAELIKGQEASESRTLPTPKLARFNHLKELVQQQRTAIEALRGLQTAIAERVETLQSKDALLWFVKTVRSSKHPLPLELAAMRAVGRNATAVTAELADALTRAREAEELLPLLEAMATAGTAVRAHAPLVIAQLQHKEEAVRERAAQALAKIAVPSAIEPMIALLGRSSGQTRLRIAAALEVLTGQQFGINAGMWQNWWTAEGKALAADSLGKGKPSKSKDGNRYYFGIPQDQSNSILYVIDCSGSMTKEVELKLEGHTATTDKGQKTTRLEACKKELIRALGMLRPEQRFAILWYNDMPHLWEPKMQPATKDAVARAQTFVQGLKPASSTNIYDSLKTCFGMVGRGVHDKYYGVELDTIFLLTDGSPTTPDGQLDSTDKILTGVREWNPLKRVTIHTIAIGRDLNATFLQQLARENGGEYKQY